MPECLEEHGAVVNTEHAAASPNALMTVRCEKKTRWRFDALSLKVIFFCPLGFTPGWLSAANDPRAVGKYVTEAVLQSGGPTNSHYINKEAMQPDFTSHTAAARAEAGKLAEELWESG